MASASSSSSRAFCDSLSPADRRPLRLLLHVVAEPVAPQALVRIGQRRRRLAGSPHVHPPWLPFAGLCPTARPTAPGTRRTRKGSDRPAAPGPPLGDAAGGTLPCPAPDADSSPLHSRAREDVLEAGIGSLRSSTAIPLQRGLSGQVHATLHVADPSPTAAPSALRRSPSPGSDKPVAGSLRTPARSRLAPGVPAAVARASATLPLAASDDSVGIAAPTPLVNARYTRRAMYRSRHCTASPRASTAPLPYAAHSRRCCSTTKFAAERRALRLWRLPARPARPVTKAGRKCTEKSFPVHSFRTLLADLATLTRNRVQPAAGGLWPPT